MSEAVVSILANLPATVVELLLALTAFLMFARQWNIQSKSELEAAMQTRAANFEEMKKLRDDLQEDVQLLRKALADSRHEVAELRATLETSREEAVHLRAEVEKLSAKLIELKEKRDE